jgi:hypothetical protein
MRLRARVEAIERRLSPTGECGCKGRRVCGFGEMLLCRDPSAPPPPRRLCDRCGRPLSRLILGPVPWAKGEKPYQPLAGLRDFYERTVRPSYEPADADTIRAMMAPPGAAP